MLVTKITNFVSGVPNLGIGFGSRASLGGVLQSKWAGEKERTGLTHPARTQRADNLIRTQLGAGI
jgi:hypothetical protein